MTGREDVLAAGWRFCRRLSEQAARAEARVLMRQMAQCGDGCGIWGRFKVTGANRIVLGDNVHIGDNAFIRAEGGLAIGSNTHISRNLVLYTLNHRFEGERLPYDREMDLRRVQIGKNVWIGMNVCITPGTRIGDGAIVGMGTVVSGEVPPLAIIGGQKWRVLGSRNEELYERLDREGAYGGPSGIAYAAARRQRQDPFL